MSKEISLLLNNIFIISDKGFFSSFQFMESPAIDNNFYEVKLVSGTQRRTPHTYLNIHQRKT